METIALEIEIGGLRRVINNVGELEQAIRDTRDELKDSGQIGSKSYQRVQRQLGKLKEVQKEVRADTRTQGREFVKAGDQGKRSYRALNAELVNLRASFKELSEAERKGAVGQSIIKNIQKLDTELKEIDASIGQFQRNVGNYRQALLGIGDIVTGGLLTGDIAELIQGFKQQVSQAVTVTADFSRQIGLLGAITGATAPQLENLEQLALKFGSSTEFTASQVAALQIEYAKLGFTAQEIEDILPSTIDAATISGEELGATANVVGSAVRAFGLDASQSGELIDVLAQSFSSSALDLNKFQVAVSNVGATATAVGQPIEQTIAQLGILANSGIKASTASTGLRNIFTRLAKSGEDLETVLAEIRNAQDPLAESANRFGLESANVALTLANQADAVDELQTSLNATRTATDSFAESQAAIVRDDLQGAIDGTKSAFEAFQITLVGLVEVGLKGFINGVADTIRFITAWIESLGSLEEIIENVKSTIQTWLPAIAGLTAAIVLNNATVIFAALTAIPQYIASLGRAIAVSRIMTIVQTLLNAALRSNPIGLIITAIGFLVTGLISAYKQSERFRAVIDGLGSVAKEFFNIVKEAFGAFINGFQQISEGNITEGLKSIGTALVKGNPITLAVTEGGRLGDAFNKGYKESIESSQATAKVNVEVDEEAENPGDKIQQQLNNSITDLTLPAELDVELDANAGEAIEDAAKKAQESVSPYKELTNAQRDLKSQIKDAIAEGRPYADLLEQYKQTTEQLNSVNDEFKSKIDNVVSSTGVAQNSIDQLSQAVSDLRSELEEGDTSNIQSTVDELIEAEQQLAEAQLEIERARDIALGGTGVLDEDIEDPIEQIEQRRQAQLLSLEQMAKDEENFAERRKQINLQADLAVLEQRRQLFAPGSAERLEIEREILAKRNELNAEADNELIENLQSRVQAAAEVLTGTFEAIGEFSDARTQREVENIENRYDREIELAEGNQEEITRLEEEKDSRIEQVEREAFERQKKLQIATALVSAAQGVVNILAAPTTIPDPFGTVFKVLRIGVLTAATAAQIASINAQTFATGGFTGKGKERDQTGHRVAGIVHENEYVVPERVLKTKEGSDLVNKLEVMRKGSRAPSDSVHKHKRLFVTGGFAEVPQVQPTLPDAGQQIISVQPKAEFDESQVRIIADAVASATREGTKTGTVEANEEVSLNNQRRERLSNLTG